MAAAALTVPLLVPVATPAGDTPCADLDLRLQQTCALYCEDLQCDEASPDDPDACDRVLAAYLRRSDGTPPPCVEE